MPINEALTQALRDQARQLLEDGRVDCVVGYEAAPRGGARPVFVRDPAEAERLIWDKSCVHNLVTYLHDHKHPRRRGEGPPRMAIVVKPCDSRAVNVLLAERQIERERVFVIGVACEGVWDARDGGREAGDRGREAGDRGQEAGDGGREAGDGGREAGDGDQETGDGSQETGDEGRETGDGGREAGDGSQETGDGGREAGDRGLAARCERCVDRTPVVYDVLLGEPPEVTPVETDYADLARVEELPPAERMAFWLREFDRCIRCYACRQVCPGCYCTTCAFERDDGLWVDAGIGLSQKHVFHLGRAFHLAGRCVECNECERVCPMGLPLSLLNRRLVREVESLYGHRAGREEALSPLLFELGEEGSPL